MKKNYLLFIALCVLCVTLFLGSCGGGPGSPGSSGSQDTGINPEITAISHSNVVSNQGDVWEIDDIQDICSGGTPEKFGNDYADITFEGIALNPNVPSTNVLTVTNYTVTFYSENPSNPTINAISAGSQGGILIEPGVGTGPYSFLIFTTGMKSTLVNALQTINGPPSLPLLYNMEIVIYGQDKYGNSFSVSIIRQIAIEDYDNC
ncbi:MAG: hypothetical protein ABSA46_00495 [Thermodesulfovibrionales bacterium]|jgi:hypothetical protein